MLANLILILIFQIYLARHALALHPAVAHTNSDLCCLCGNQDSVKAAIQDALNICHKFASAALTSVNKKLWMCGTQTILSSAAHPHHHTRLAPQVQTALVIKSIQQLLSSTTLQSTNIYTLLELLGGRRQYIPPTHLLDKACIGEKLGCM